MPMPNSQIHAMTSQNATTLPKVSPASVDVAALPKIDFIPEFGFRLLLSWGAITRGLGFGRRLGPKGLAVGRRLPSLE